MILRCLTCFGVLFLAGISPVYADTKILTAEATYIMGDGETPSFAEAMALQKAKQTALEEAGTYVQSYTRSVNQDLTKDEIQTLAGGVLQVEVLEKTRTLVGEGLSFYTKIRASVTTDKMEELARRIKGKDVTAEYTKLQAEYARLNRELEDWKQRAAKTPRGQEHEAALDQIREREKAFSQVQQREGDLFQRLVSGRQLVESASHDKAIVDELLNTIVTSGYVVTVGAVQSVLLPSDSSQLSLTVPFTIRVSETLHEAVLHAVEALGGSERSARVLLDFAGLNGERAVVDDDRTTVTLVRLGRDHGTAWYFQESVRKLVVSIAFFDGTRELARCNIFPWKSPPGDRWRWSPVGRIVPVSKSHTLCRPSHWPDRRCVEVPEVYRAARSSEGGEPYVAIVQGEVTLLALYDLPAAAVRSLTGVRIMVDNRSLTYTDKECIVIGK